MATVGDAVIKIKADTTELQHELASLSFWRVPSLGDVIQMVLLAGILWRIW